MYDERFPLGKPIRQPEQPKADVVEEVRPGLYRRNGKLETWIPVPGPQYAPVPQPVVEEVDIQVFTTKRWDEMTGILHRQEDDGYPLNEFGVM